MLDLRSLDHLAGGRVLITGGTGSLGRKLLSILLERSAVESVVVFSRDEFKQHEMAVEIPDEHHPRIRFFLGDVRDGGRLRRAMEGVDYVVHAAALKQVPAAEYNPFEFIKTNINGAQNVVEAALDCGVRRIVALSTDKAANPINLYGATKLCSDKLFVSANNQVGAKATRFCVVRYGNVVGSRGSVIPYFLTKRKSGVLPITSPEMTRFWITLEQGAALVLNAFDACRGGEIYVPKIPSMNIIDLAKAVAPECDLPEVGIRPGEKLHEVMIPVEDGRNSLAFRDHFVVLPQQEGWVSGASRAALEADGGTPCEPGFFYGSDNNPQTLGPADLAEMIRGLDLPEAREWAAEQAG
ncbi:UDP-N-acetylglucosamine 4,6-dehydratase (inverting) [soil metagenome]